MFLTTGTILLLCLVSVSRSAPLVCEELVRPLDRPNLHHFEGRWVMVAGGLSYLPNLEHFKLRESATADVRNISGNSLFYTRSIRLNNKCNYTSYNISMEGSSFTFNGTHKNNVSGVFVRTSCPDCMVMHINLAAKQQHHFYLFSRRRQLEQAEMEEFSAQVKCLNLLPPVVLDPTKELCPVDDPNIQPGDKTEGQKN